MFYILSEHVVYIDLSPEYCQSWTNYSDTMIQFVINVMIIIVQYTVNAPAKLVYV